MAICMIQTFPANPDVPDNAGFYDQLNEKMGTRENPPDGCLAHSAGQSPDGWRLVDFWESREHFDRFFQERLAPALKEVTGQDPENGPMPDVQEWELHSVFPEG